MTARTGRAASPRRRFALIFTLAAVAWTAGFTSGAQARTIETVAGGGIGDDVPALDAGVGFPRGIVIDPVGNLYFADQNYHRVRKIDPAGIMTTVAGNGLSGYSGDGGPATAARLHRPADVDLGPGGALYVADSRNSVIRRIDLGTGVITTFAGTGVAGWSGDGGPAAAAQLALPQGLDFDPAGQLFVADTGNQRIRKIAGGTITTIAGDGLGRFAGDGGLALSGSFSQPYDVSDDGAGNLYVADSKNHRIRKIDSSGMLSTVAGDGSTGTAVNGVPATSTPVSGPLSVAADGSGQVFLSSRGSSSILKVDSSGIISRAAGCGGRGFTGDGGSAAVACLEGPWAVALGNGGEVLIADTGNYRLRRVDAGGIIETIAGPGVRDGNPATDAVLSQPFHTAFDPNSGAMYVADQHAHRVRKIDASGTITTFAGTGLAGFSGDGGPATAARLRAPSGLAVDASGHVYIGDEVNKRVRKVDGSGTITTIVSEPDIFFPTDLAIDSAGNLYISDRVKNRIFRRDPAGTLTVHVGAGAAGFSGDGGPASAAQIRTPTGIAVDASDNLYFLDNGNRRIRRVDNSGIIDTVVGTGASGTPADGTHASAARIVNVSDLAVDSAGRLAFDLNSAVYLVNECGFVFREAGTSHFGFDGDGGPARDALMTNAAGVTYDAADRLHVSDRSNHRIRRVEACAPCVYPNLPPFADAGADQSVDEGDLVQLDGTGSADPNCDPLTHSWIQVAGPPASLDLTDPARPVFSAPSVPAGGAVLTFDLTVGDGTAFSAPATVNVTVTNVNQAPLADAGADQTVSEGTAVVLDGSGSTDLDGDPISFAWGQLSGPSVTLSGATTASPSFTAPVVGAAGAVLEFELEVDDGALTGTDAVRVSVQNVNQPPTADAGADITTAEGSATQLDGTGSSDPDGDALTHSWVQTTGTPVLLSDPALAAPHFTAPLVGPGGETLSFELTVEDDSASATDAVDVFVQNVNDPPACERARASVESLWPPKHGLTEIGILGVSDPDDDSVSISITGVTQDEPVDGTGDGNTSPDALLGGPAALVRAERAGGGNGRVYALSFDADDGQGGTCSGVVTVEVPHSRRSGAVDDGQQHDSTAP